MTIAVPPPRPFEPGTTGWSARDLNDPHIEPLWEQGHYEIVEGVLATMPPANLDGGVALQRLMSMVKQNVDQRGLGGDFAFEIDLIVSDKRVARPDAMLLTAAEMERQRTENSKRGRREYKYGRVLIPATLAVESVSLGHEAHDRELKRRWYADFGIPNYWILDAQRRTLDCLTLQESAYVVDQSGKDHAVLTPSGFPGLVIELKRLWL